jgi:hypothetical protein
MDLSCWPVGSYKTAHDAGFRMGLVNGHLANFQARGPARTSDYFGIRSPPCLPLPIAGTTRRAGGYDLADGSEMRLPVVLLRCALLTNLFIWFTHPTINRVILLLLTVLLGGCSVLLIPSLLAAIMMFDAPGSTRRLLPWAVLGITFFWPVVMLAGAITAYLCLAAHHPVWAYVSIGIPLLPFMALMVMLGRSKIRTPRTDGRMPQPPADQISDARDGQPGKTLESEPDP